MKSLKLMLAALALTLSASAPLLAANVSGSCSTRLFVRTRTEVISCDLTGIYVNGNGDIVGCEYTC